MAVPPALIGAIARNTGAAPIVLPTALHIPKNTAFLCTTAGCLSLLQRLQVANTIGALGTNLFD